MNKPESVTNIRCTLGEGPIWDSQNHVICWIDITAAKIHEYSPETNNVRTFTLTEMVGAVALTVNGNYIAALQNGFAFINRATAHISPIADPEKHLPNNRFNDGKCDPSGRFWAGSMSLSEETNAGSLYKLDHHLQIKKMIDGVTISNGMAWTADKKTFYFIDTPTQQVVKYDYDDATGSIKNKAAVIKIAEADGHPDGMTIDTEGMLWIAHWGGWQITRWDPVTSTLLLCIKMPVKNVTSCTFGGNKMSDLYITTARKDLSPSELQKQPLAGSLFVIKNSGYTGHAPFRFRALDNIN